MQDENGEMIVERGVQNLFEQLERQLTYLFHYDRQVDQTTLEEAFVIALQRTGKAFSYTDNKYYRRGDEVYFNPYQSSQNSIFLYFLSHTLGRTAAGSCLADRIYYLNRTLNSVDLYHQVQLPDVFFLDHPVGTVIGRATFGEYFSFSQNCTVGNNKGIYPQIGNNVQMKAGSAIIGDCCIADNVIVAAYTLIKDEHIPRNSLVFGQSPNLLIKSRPEEYFSKLVVNPN